MAAATTNGSAHRVKIVKFKRMPVMAVHPQEEMLAPSSEDHLKETSEPEVIAAEAVEKPSPEPVINLLSDDGANSSPFHYEQTNALMEMANRRPVMVNAMTALSHTYALPPLTAALPMDLLEKLAFDLGNSEPAAASSSLIEPESEHSSPTYTLLERVPHPVSPKPRPVQVVPVQMLPPVMSGHLIHAPEPVLHTHSSISNVHFPPLSHHHPHSPVRVRHYDSPDHVPGIPGRAWKDYPMFSEVPKTSFSCAAASYGYYADMETGCQVSLI